MQSNQPVTFFTLFLTFSVRWLASNLVGWAVGLILLTILLFFVGAFYGASGMTQDQILKKAETLVIVIAAPIFFGIIPLSTATIAFFWTLSSDQAKAYVVAKSGIGYQPHYPQPQPGQQVSGADANAQYAAAYQKWQVEYAEYQRRMSGESRPPTGPTSEPGNGQSVGISTGQGADSQPGATNSNQSIGSDDPRNSDDKPPAPPGV